MREEVIIQAIIVILIIMVILLLFGCTMPEHRPMSEWEREELLERERMYVEEHKDDYRPYTVTPRPNEN